MNTQPQLQDGNGNDKAIATMAPREPESERPSFVKRSLWAFILRMAGIVVIIWIIRKVVFNG